ncbi:MAG: hypothetical protein M9924_12970 [Rhizobiaceae bacterium]|nr:hypothetical protein [Rhizobiaceae bacterium]
MPTGPKPSLTRERARDDHWQMLRFMLLHAGLGCLIGAITAAIIIYLDLGGIGTLISHSSNPVIPILLIVVPFASIFGGAVTASAIVLMPYEKKFKD